MRKEVTYVAEPGDLVIWLGGLPKAGVIERAGVQWVLSDVAGSFDSTPYCTPSLFTWNEALAAWVGGHVK